MFTFFSMTYVIIAALIFFVSGLLIGYDSPNFTDGNENTKTNIKVLTALIALFWPFVLFAFIILFPCYGAFKLGEYCGEKTKKEEENHEFESTTGNSKNRA